MKPEDQARQDIDEKLFIPNRIIQCCLDSNLCTCLDIAIQININAGWDRVESTEILKNAEDSQIRGYHAWSRIRGE